VREVTIASTLPRMLTGLVAVGDDLTPMPMDAAGVTMVIDDITVSGD
jgi:predicted Zn-dependent protease